MYSGKLRIPDLLSIPFCVLGGVTYDVPRSISIVDDNSTVQGSFVSFPDGTVASAAFRNDSALSMRYFALSGTTSATYASEKSFFRSNQYAFYEATKNQYNARLRDYVDDLNEKALETGVADLTKPFNGVNPNILKQYQDFFERYGSSTLITVHDIRSYVSRTTCFFQCLLMLLIESMGIKQNRRCQQKVCD